MKLLLHIGTEKTGTSSIQRALVMNKSILLRFGTAIYDEKISLFKLGMVTPGGRQFDQVGNILSSIQKLSMLPGLARVVVSSELLQSRLSHDQQVRTLKERLDSVGMFSEYLIIIYLRRPAAIANSMASTAVQYDRKEKQSLYSDYLDNICAHRRTIERWAHIFGWSNVTPRIFDKSFFFNGNLVDDFFHLIDESFVPIIKKPKDFNPQISVDAINIMGHVNEYLREITNSASDKDKLIDTAQIRSLIYARLERFLSEPKFVMEPEHWFAYDIKYRDSDEWVRENYFPESDKLWGYNLPSTGSMPAITEDAARQIARLLVSYEVDRSCPNDNTQDSRDSL